jgi:hypothetical protein
MQTVHTNAVSFYIQHKEDLSTYDDDFAREAFIKEVTPHAEDLGDSELQVGIQIEFKEYWYHKTEQPLRGLRVGKKVELIGGSEKFQELLTNRLYKKGSDGVSISCAMPCCDQ